MSDTDGAVELVTPELLARYFHDQYEMLAPSFGWRTQLASTEWDDAPEENRRLMTAVAMSVLMRIFPERMSVPHDPPDKPDVVTCSIVGHPLRDHNCGGWGR